MEESKVEKKCCKTCALWSACNKCTESWDCENYKKGWGCCSNIIDVHTKKYCCDDWEEKYYGKWE